MSTYRMGWRAQRRRARAHTASEARHASVLAATDGQRNGHFLRFDAADRGSLCCHHDGDVVCGQPAVLVRVVRYWAYSLDLGRMPGTQHTPVCLDHQE